MTTERQQVLIPVAALRKICGDADGVVQRLVQSRQIPAKDGRVSLVAGVRAFLEHVRAEARNASLTSARDEAREARAEAAELDLDIGDRRLVPTEDAENAITDACGAVTREIASIAARVTRDLPARRAIEGALYEAQSALAQSFALGTVGTSAAKPRRKGGAS